MSRSDDENIVVKRAFIYGFLFTFFLLVFLVVSVPAGFVWKQVQGAVDLRQQGVVVQSVQGHWWRGQVLAKVQNQPVLLNWELAGSGWWRGYVPLQLRMESYLGELDAEVLAGIAETHIRVPRAELALAGLNALLRRQRVELDGRFTGQNLSLTLEDGVPVSAEGRLAWSGGDIAYPAGRDTHERTLPAFSGRISTTDQGEIQLDIRDHEADFAVIEGLLTPDNGVGLLQVRRRLLDLSSEPWSARSTEQDVVFKVKKSLFPANRGEHG